MKAKEYDPKHKIGYLRAFDDVEKPSKVSKDFSKLPPCKQRRAAKRAVMMAKLRKK